MSKQRKIKQLAAAIILIGSGSASFAACNQTLSPGANVATAISSAAAGTIVCLNPGSYGAVSVANIVKSGDVVVQTTSGNGASLSINISQSNHVRFENLTITGLQIDTNQRGGSKNITVRGSKFTGQAVFNMGNNGNANILIDGNTFDGINACSNCYEGRLQVIANPWSSTPSGVVISNNHFGGAGESDGIQNGANGVVIGPGNVFDGIVQGNYSRHVDAIQLYGQARTTITGNIFRNGDTYVMAPDGGESEVFTNNVFVGYGSYYWKLQLGSHANDTFSHNTVIGGSSGIGVSIDAKTGESVSSNAVVRNNIMVGSTFKTVDSGGRAACSNCTFSSNLFNSSGNAFGSGYIVGTPAFVGGASPTTWSGFQLTSSSLGYRVASDGQDMGIVTTGTTPPPAATLAAPTNLRVN